jgi:hypothetical protein
VRSAAPAAFGLLSSIALRATFLVSLPGACRRRERRRLSTFILVQEF